MAILKKRGKPVANCQASQTVRVISLIHLAFNHFVEYFLLP